MFYAGLAWLIKSIHSQLSQTHPEKEVNSICTDLIWALFICPAVTNPEPFGVTDAPVGTQARHTLSQVRRKLVVDMIRNVKCQICHLSPSSYMLYL